MSVTAKDTAVPQAISTHFISFNSDTGTGTWNQFSFKNISFFFLNLPKTMDDARTIRTRWMMHVQQEQDGWCTYNKNMMDDARTTRTRWMIQVQQEHDGGCTYNKNKMEI